MALQGAERVQDGTGGSTAESAGAGGRGARASAEANVLSGGSSDAAYPAGAALSGQLPTTEPVNLDLEFCDVTAWCRRGV
eukprot:438963-Rhodomonas_salina.3